MQKIMHLASVFSSGKFLGKKKAASHEILIFYSVDFFLVDLDLVSNTSK